MDEYHDEKPYELVNLEKFLRDLRHVADTSAFTQVGAFVVGNSDSLDRAHAYVRGMIYGI